jgi:hypothetical protein
VKTSQKAAVRASSVPFELKFGCADSFFRRASPLALPRELFVSISDEKTHEVMCLSMARARWKEDDDVKKEKVKFTRRERRKTTSKRRSSSRRSTFTTARSREHYYPRGGVVPSRFFGFGFSRRARVRAFSSRLLFSRRMMVQRETL